MALFVCACGLSFMVSRVLSSRLKLAPPDVTYARGDLSERQRLLGFELLLQNRQALVWDGLTT